MKINESVSDKEIAQELNPEYMSPCSKLTFVTDIQIANKTIRELRIKESSLVMLRKISEEMN